MLEKWKRHVEEARPIFVFHNGYNFSERKSEGHCQWKLPVGRVVKTGLSVIFLGNSWLDFRL